MPSLLHEPWHAILEDRPTTSTRDRICAAFSDAQKTTAGHRKLVIALRTLQVTCLRTVKKGDRSIDHTNEDGFNDEFARCMLRVICVKKGEGVGDRLVKFIASFIKYADEKEEHPEHETPTTRLISHLFAILTQFFNSKEKVVRYRSTQLVAHIINSLDSIDDECCSNIQACLLKRLKDRETSVRVQAVLGLGRLAGNEAHDESDHIHGDISTLTSRLLDALQNDSSPEVRRSLLLNLPLAPTTLPYLLERARDTDATVRRALYSRLLPALGDFRHLSLAMREKLLRLGLRDRDSQVQMATARLFRERWIGDCVSSADCDDSEVNTASVNLDALLELLERIDIVNSGIEEGIAKDAMAHFWAGRPDYENGLDLQKDSFWKALTPESAFMARTLVEYKREKADKYQDSAMDEQIPELTRLAHILEFYANGLIQKLQRVDVMQQSQEEQITTVEESFVIEQLLHLLMAVDYADEIGRRKLFGLLREMLATAELPEEITKLSVDVLRSLCSADAAGEREFCSVIVEAIAEVHDVILSNDARGLEEDESFHSAKSEVSTLWPTDTSSQPPSTRYTPMNEEARAMQEIIINLKCLHIAQCMLQNVDGGLQENVHTVTMLNNLVVPAVRSHEAPIREKGLVCLGLCCLLDKELAEENLTLFLHCFNKGHATLQVVATHILADVVSSFPSLLNSKVNDIDFHKSVKKIFQKGLQSYESPDVQTAATVSLCKLLLRGLLQDEKLLEDLVICFINPANRTNISVVQTLSYFIPVYCYSRRQNMMHMAHAASDILQAVVELDDDLAEDNETIDMMMISNMIIEWTDTRRVVGVHAPPKTSTENSIEQAGHGDVHLELAIDILGLILNGNSSKIPVKIMLTMLGKLHIGEGLPVDRLHEADILVSLAVDNAVASDGQSRTSLNKLQLAVHKALTGQKVSAPSPDLPTPRATSLTSENLLTAPQAALSDTTEISQNDAGDARGNGYRRPPIQGAESNIDEDEDDGDGYDDDEGDELV